MWLNVINHPQNLNFYGWYKLSINHQKWSGLLWSAPQYLVFVLRMYWPNGPNCKRSRAWLAPKAWTSVQFCSQRVRFPRSPQSRCHKGTVMLWLPWCFCKRWMLTSFYWGFLVNTSILPQYRSIPWIVCANYRENRSGREFRRLLCSPANGPVVCMHRAIEEWIWVCQRQSRSMWCGRSFSYFLTIIYSLKRIVWGDFPRAEYDIVP